MQGADGLVPLAVFFVGMVRLVVEDEQLAASFGDAFGKARPRGWTAVISAGSASPARSLRS
jgi:hypothetical protein